MKLHYSIAEAIDIIMKNGTIDTDDADSSELRVCVSDHLPEDCQHYWPCWK